MEGASGIITKVWQDSLPGGSWAAIPGATAFEYVVPTGSPHTTYYRIFITDTGAECPSPVISNEVLVEVNADPVVNVTVSDGNICVGASAVLDGNITGGSTSQEIQWQSGAALNGPWTDIPGADSSSYVFTASTIGTAYFRVVLTDTSSGCTPVYPSNPTSVIIVYNDAAVTISTPTPEFCVGGSSTLQGSISGGSSGFTRQWQSSPTGTDTWSNIPGATGSNYSVPNSTPHWTDYRLVINDPLPDCSDPISNVLTIKVNADASANVSPDTTRVCIGGDAPLTATITGGSSALNFIWYSNPSTSPATWTAVPGFNNTSVFTPPTSVTGTTYYRIQFTDPIPGCGTGFANTVRVIVSPDLSITAQPNNITECVGGNTLLNVAVTGGSGAISYQWQSSNINVPASFANIGGATGTSYMPPSGVVGTTYYRVIIDAANSGCDAVISSTATVIITEDIAITAQPNDISECVGGTETLVASITGGTGTIGYQWQSSTTGVSNSFINVGGATNATYQPPSVSAGITWYRVIVSASGAGCEDPISDTAMVTIYPDLVVSAQPTNIAECVGGNDQMQVTISGGSGLVSYQWQSSPNGTGSWTNASGSGATTSLFTPPSSSPGTTWYRVLVNATGNGCGQTISNTVTAIISADLVITAQPGSILECIGGTSTLSVTVTGGSGLISYQWEVSDDGISGWTNATGPGATTGIYTPPSSAAGIKYYRVIVDAANTGCEAVQSGVASVTVYNDITVVTSPVGGSICAGGIDTLSVTASGSPGLHYQWQRQNGASWVVVGADQNTFITAPLTTTTVYRVVVSAIQSGCDPAVSGLATVTVYPDISISAQPSGGAICAGGIDTLSVTASGAPALNYLWQQQNGASWLSVGTNQNTYITPALTTSTVYRVIVSAVESGCEPMISSSTTVTVFPDIAIVANPQGGSICEGGIDTLFVTASGAPTLNYQWQQESGTTWINVGSNQNSFISPPLFSSTVYRVLVSAPQSGCESSVSGTTMISVYPDIAIDTEPTGGIICSGGMDTLSVIASGSPGLHYQWQLQNGANWLIVGSDNNTFITPELTSTTTYRVIVSASQSGCQAQTSQEVTVTVTPDINIDGQPQSASICEGGDVTLNVLASGSPGLLYQWEIFSGSSWDIISGANASSYNTGALTSSTDYRVFVFANESGCEDLYSDIITVTVTPDIIITGQPVGDSICEGGDLTLNVIASGSPGILYQWETFNGSAWVSIPGANASSYYTGALNVTTQYRVNIFANESGCEDVFSVPVTITIVPDILIVTAPVGTSICEGGSADLSVVTTGSPSIEYQWEIFVGSNWISIPGANASTYNTGNLNATTQYRVYAFSTDIGCEDVYSEAAIIEVVPDIEITGQPVGGSICVGGNFDLNISANGSPNILYQWEVLVASTWTPIGGATLPDFNTGILNTTTQYRAFIYATESGCEDVYSAIVSVIVEPDIAISVQPTGAAICTDGTADLLVDASGSPNIMYQWQDSTAAGTWQDVDEIGGTTNGFTTFPLSQTTWYRVLVFADESGCEDVFSNEVAVIVSPDIAISAQPVGGSICTGGDFDLSVTASGSPDIHFQWQYFNGTAWTNVGLDQPTYNTGALTSTTTYRVFVNADESGCEDVNSAEVVVTVTPDIVISAQPVGGSICTGGNFDLSVTANGSPDIHYQWQFFNGTDWINVGLDQPTYNTGVLTSTTTYRVFVSADENGCEDVTSSEVIVTVTPDIVISAQPVGGSICTGGNFDLSVTASGSPDIHYQWQSFNGSAWANVGIDQPTYNTGVLTATTTYRVFVNADESGCEDVMSASVIVTVTPDIVN